MKTIKLNTLKPNDRNPRKISADALAKLCESIERDHQFMELRPIVVDEGNVILGGNQRYAACLKLGKKEVPASWVKCAVGLTAEQRKRFILVDNAPEGMAGDWDLELLKIDWALPELTDLGFEALLSELERIDRPEGDKAGASPWDRVGDAAEGIMFSFGNIQRRVPVELYEAFSSAVGADNVEEWLREALNH